MAKDKDKDQDRDDESPQRRQVPPPQFDGDLNFATDSTPGLGKTPRLEKDAGDAAAPEEPVEGTWVMFDGPENDPNGHSGDGENGSAAGNGADGAQPSLSDTWVPEPKGTDGSEHHAEAASAPAGDDGKREPDEITTEKDRPVKLADTWVPFDSKAGADEHDAEPAGSEEQATHHDFSFEAVNTDSESQGEESDEDDPHRTWVPSATPTVNSDELAAEADDAADGPDPDKTWVPSETPTVTGAASEAADAGEVEDVDKTWVPSKTPTVNSDDMPDDGAGDDADPEKTWVPSATPTVHGNDGPDPETGTIVMPRDDDAATSDSAVMDTIVSDVDSGTDKTQIFSKTMGMRGLTEDEYDEWQEQVAEKSMSDTDVAEDEKGGSDSTMGNRTQIWSKQSGDGLDASLNIRSRPVEGVKEFSDLLGEDAADYQIVEKLAEGGMGAIYIANQRSLDRELAIKTLKPLRESEVRSFTKQGRISQVQKQRREMFLSEALVTANLVHPHIIPIHDLCQTGDGSPFYSMKRVHGTPWNELIAQMPPEENLEVLHKVCDAMAYAHHNGVVNRDLKPENIMLGEFGEVLVLDWGLAVPATDADKRRVASPSASFGAGTPAYMSPELWAGPADAIGPCSDIYLLGAILFEAITGKPPHRFPEPESKKGNSGLWMVIDKVVRSNQIRDTDVTGELMDIARKAMSTDPGDRHATVLEFQEAVKNYQDHEESRRLSTRATETMEEAAKPGTQSGYQSYQTAAALYEESFATWSENEEARHGLRKTRLDYATLAHTNGDYDLGLQIAAQEDGAEFLELRKRLSRSRRIRNGLKSATLAALAIIVVGGIFSAYQAVRITALHGNVASLEVQKQEAVRLTDEAVVAREQAIAQKAAVEEEKKEIEGQKEQVEIQMAEATEALEGAEIKLAAAKTETSKALVAKEAAVEAQMAAIALKKEADTNLAMAKVQLEEVAEQVAGLEEQKARARVNLHYAEIANLIHTADYASALRGVNELLAALEQDPELEELPELERGQRVAELKARRDQLLRRTVRTEEPVQAQVISPSGKRVAWGDLNGRLQLWPADSSPEDFPRRPLAEITVDGEFSAIQFSQDESLVVGTADDKLVIWDPTSNTIDELPSIGGHFSTVRLSGDTMVAADTAGNIRSWNLKTRQPLWKIRSAAAIRDLVLLPQSNIFLYAGSRGGESADILAYRLPPKSDPTARPQRLGQLRLARGHINPPRRIAVSPSEQTLVISNSRNGDLLVLPRRPVSELSKNDEFPFQHPADMKAAGSTSWLVKHHQRPVNDLNFSADGRRLVSASDDRTIGVWSVAGNAELELIERLKGHGGRVNAASFLDREGTRVLSASADRFCRFWDVDNYRRHRDDIKGHFDLSSLPLKTASTRKDSGHRGEWIPAVMPVANRSKMPVGRTLLASEEYRVLNADGRTQRGTLSAVVISQDAEAVITAGADGTAVMWDIASGQPMEGLKTGSEVSQAGRFEEGHDFNVARLSFLPPDGGILMTTGFDGNLCLWDADIRKAGAGRQEVRVPGLGLVNAVAPSPDGRLIVTSAVSDEGRSGAAAVWSIDRLLQNHLAEPVCRLEGFHRAEVSAVAFSRDSKLVVTGARDGRMAVWDATTGQRLKAGQTHARNTIVSHLEWIADNRVLTAGFDGRIQIVSWSPLAGDDSLEIERSFQHDRIPVERLALSPDHSRFVTISVRTDRASGTVTSELESWNLDSSRRNQRILPAGVSGQPGRRIDSVNWSPDGEKLAAVVDENLQIFETDNWRVQKVLEAPGVGISDAVFAPNHISEGGNVIATFDGTAAHLWKLSDRSHIASFRPLYAIQSMAMNANSDEPLLLTGDRAIRIFCAGANSSQFGETLFKISDPHRGVVTSLEWSPQSESRRFVSAGADGSADLWQWDAQRASAVKTAVISKQGTGIVASTWSPDGSRVLLARKDGTVELYSADPLRLLSQLELSDVEAVEIAAAAFSSDGRYFAIGGQIVSTGESRGWVFDIEDSSKPLLHASVTGHEAGGIRALQFLPDSPYLVTGGADGAALIWNWQPYRTDGPVDAYLAYELMQDGAVVAHRAPIESLAVSPKGLICTSSEDGTAVVWNNPFAAD